MGQDGSLVVVTGAGGALGRAVARAFAADGARLLLIDAREDALAATARALEKEVETVSVDLTDDAAVSVKLTPLLDRLGPVKVLCNIAGGFDMGPAVHQTSGEMWRRLLDVNVTTMLNVCRAVVPHLLAANGGAVINMGAASAATGRAQMGAYCASKSAVARLTESMAFELRESGINVNAIAPSIIDTPVNREAMPDADFGRWVTAEQLADVFLFLASDKAKAIHGAVIPVVGLS